MRRRDDPDLPRVHRTPGVQLTEQLLAGDLFCDKKSPEVMVNATSAIRDELEERLHGEARVGVNYCCALVGITPKSLYAMIVW